MRSLSSLSFAVIAAVLTACGTNPVTGKTELQFVSESQEIKLGQQSYAPARQSEGGEMEVMPELTAYINEVGQKLAAVADRKLPYEFHVLNNSVPNAWAMPGGKIAMNRGLLVELKNEAELAAVLGHEIVHAAARHGAKAQERGTLMQAGMAVAQIGAAVSGVDSNLAGIAVAGAGAGLQMVQMKYGRDQELEADSYGMKYMKQVGYDPTGAVTLQETFVRLSKEKSNKQGFFDKMFASHPPSAERVQKNREMAASLGANGELGEQRYQTRLAALFKAKPAYDKYDKATAALTKKDYAAATTQAKEAVALLPQEGRFHQLLGDIELAQKHNQEAIPHYEKAMSLSSNYFGPYLGGGIAQYQAGNKAKAQEWLKRSHELLPTKNAAYYLGNIARERGDLPTALQHYKSAAGSDSGIGQLAAKEYVELDLASHPEEYIATGTQVDTQGRVLVIIQNRAPIALRDIQVTPVFIDAGGRILQQGTSLRIPQVIESGKQFLLNSGLSNLSVTQIQALRVRVDTAKVVEGTQ